MGNSRSKQSNEYHKSNFELCNKCRCFKKRFNEKIKHCDYCNLCSEYEHCDICNICKINYAQDNNNDIYTFQLTHCIKCNKCHQLDKKCNDIFLTTISFPEAQRYEREYLNKRLWI